MRLSPVLLAAFALAAALPAQRTWIVDPYNLPGTHFTTIQAAVDAAATGDIVLVRDRQYPQGFRATGKGLTILGDRSFDIVGDEVVI